MRRIALFLILPLVLGAGGTLIYFKLIYQPPLPEGLIQANGRIEADHITITTKFAGRVVELKAQEGDNVKAGQVVALLDDTQVRAKVEQARQNLAALQAQVESGQTALAVLQKEVPLQIAAAEADVARANAGIEQAMAGKSDAEIALKRLRRASQSEAATQYELERTELSVKVAEEEITSTRMKLKQAQTSLTSAKLGDERIAAKKEDLTSLRAQRDAAKAALAEAESVLADMTLRSPADGVVTTKTVNLGEVVPAGAPLYDLVDLNQLYLKVYVPEFEIGKLRLNLKARIYTDAYPDRPFDATVRYIASKAEFTPKEVQTPDERVKLVFAVKLYLDANPEHCLTPGMPADAVIRWKEQTPWARPRW
jgi:HlyD family secretion protein